MRCAARTGRRTAPAPSRNDPRRRRGRARGSSACPSCSPRSTSARSEDHQYFDSRKPSRAPRASFGRWPGNLGWSSSPRSSSGARRASTTTRRCPRRRRRAPGPLPQDAHPRRPALLREILLHARRPRLPVVEHAKGPARVCVCWDQWFPEAARLTALSGAQLLFYPTAIGWHPGREGSGVRPRAAQLLGDDPARARHRQRLLRRGGQPRGPRGPGGRRGHRVLGAELPVRSRPGRFMAQGGRPRRGDRRG